MSVKLDRHKGVQIFVGMDGEFYCEDPKVSSPSLPILKKQIESFLKKRRKSSFEPIEVIFLTMNELEDPERETVIGLNGTTGLVRTKDGHFGTWGGQYLFLPEEFPQAEIDEVIQKQKEVEVLQKKIRQRARYYNNRRTGMEAADLIEKEEELSALFRQKVHPSEFELEEVEE